MGLCTNIAGGGGGDVLMTGDWFKLNNTSIAALESSCIRSSSSDAFAEKEKEGLFSPLMCVFVSGEKSINSGL